MFFKTTLSDYFLDLNRVVISLKMSDILQSSELLFFKIEIFCGSGNQTTDQGSVKYSLEFNWYLNIIKLVPATLLAILR